MKFEMPKIKVEKFDKENIVTTSSISTAAQELAEGMAATAKGGVNVVDWSMYSE